jgi:peptidoglycan/LPS O-acetylase OafA/YrhL
VLVNYSVEKERGWGRVASRVPRAVRWLAPVGLISYSLYLTHLLVLMKWYWFGFLRLHILSVTLLVMTPLSILFAWAFYRVFERPFMTRPKRALPHAQHAPQPVAAQPELSSAQ